MCEHGKYLKCSKGRCCLHIHHWHLVWVMRRRPRSRFDPRQTHSECGGGGAVLIQSNAVMLIRIIQRRCLVPACYRSAECMKIGKIKGRSLNWSKVQYLSKCHNLYQGSLFFVISGETSWEKTPIFSWFYKKLDPFYKKKLQITSWEKTPTSHISLYKKLNFWK